MATILSIDIPNAQQTAALNDFCVGAGYEGRKLEGETKAQFFKRMTIDFIKDTIKQGKIRTNIATATQTAINDVETNVTLS